MQRLFPAATLQLLVFLEDGILMAPVVDIGKLEKDQPQHRGAVFGGFQVGVRAKIVSGGPEVVFELFQLFFVQCLTFSLDSWYKHFNRRDRV